MAKIATTSQKKTTTVLTQGRHSGSHVLIMTLERRWIELSARRHERSFDLDG
jgi:hypothetical protein